MVECLVDRGLHVTGLRFAYQGTVPRGDGDFRFVAALFDGEDDLRIELVAQDFSDLGQAGFD